MQLAAGSGRQTEIRGRRSEIRISDCGFRISNLSNCDLTDFNAFFGFCDFYDFYKLNDLLLSARRLPLTDMGFRI